MTVGQKRAAKYSPGQKSRLDKMVCGDEKYAWKKSGRCM